MQAAQDLGMAAQQADDQHELRDDDDAERDDDDGHRTPPVPVRPDGAVRGAGRLTRRVAARRSGRPVSSCWTVATATATTSAARAAVPPPSASRWAPTDSGTGASAATPAATAIT